MSNYKLRNLTIEESKDIIGGGLIEDIWYGIGYAAHVAFESLQNSPVHAGHMY